MAISFHRNKSVFVCGAAAILAGTLFCSSIRSAAADTPAGYNIRSVMLFPIANNSGSEGDQVAPMIDDAVRLRLAAVNKFTINRFSRLFSSVQQGLENKELTEADVQTPFADDDKDQPRAGKIAQRVGVDAYFVGNLDSYKADPASKTVTLQLTGSVYLTDSGVSAKSVGTSVTAKAINSSDQLDTVVQYAVNDAASQIASSINAIPLSGPESAPKSEIHSRTIGSGGLLIALLGGALIYAALHHDSNNSSSSPNPGTTTSGPPAPPGIPGGG